MAMSKPQSTAPPPLPRPVHLFPLVRQLSWPLTRLLLRLPLTANHVTIASIAVGLAAVWCFFESAWLAGALLFVLSFVLDNCDGEVARARGSQSRLGARLDDFGDWLVHSALFVAMGKSASQVYAGEIWLWLGCIAALGVTIENGLQLAEPGAAAAQDRPAPDPAGRSSWLDRAIYLFRVLLDADFCFLVLALVLLDGLQVLLVGAAIGSHAYWAAGFYQNARKLHV